MRSTGGRSAPPSSKIRASSATSRAAAAVSPLRRAAWKASTVAAAAWKSTVALKGGDLWLNWAMLAREKARSGNEEEAIRSADVALSKTKNEARSTDAVRKLKTAIADGCYASDRDGCDPLLGWQVAVGTPAAGAR